MEEARRMNRQIRVVLIVFRAEKRRLQPLIQSGDARPDRLDDLRARSLEILDAERAKLDGKAAWHPRLLRRLTEARAEISGTD
jgi:hypothetical protein